MVSLGRTGSSSLYTLRMPGLTHMPISAAGETGQRRELTCLATAVRGRLEGLLPCSSSSEESEASNSFPLWACSSIICFVMLV